MFEEIEKCFKEKSQIRNNFGMFVFLVVIYIVIALLITLNNPENFLLCLIPASAVYVISYLFVFIKNVFFNPLFNKRWYLFFNIDYNIGCFVKWQRGLDKKFLVKLLKKNGVNSNSKLIHIIEHYRVRVICNTKSITFISILAICISAGSFVFGMVTDLNNIVFLMIIISFAILLWFFCLSINKLFINKFSRNALNMMMEELLTEIYIDDELNDIKSERKYCCIVKKNRQRIDKSKINIF